MRSLSSEDSFFSTIEERPSSSLDSEKISAEDLLSILWIGYLLPRIWFGIILRLEFLLVHASNFKPLFLDKICGSSINFPLSGLVPKNGERLWNVNPPQLFSPWFTLLRSISINLIRRIRGMISSLSTGAGTERQHSLIRISGISLSFATLLQIRRRSFWARGTRKSTATPRSSSLVWFLFWSGPRPWRWSWPGPRSALDLDGEEVIFSSNAIFKIAYCCLTAKNKCIQMFI